MTPPTDPRMAWALWLVRVKRMPITQAAQAVEVNPHTAWRILTRFGANLVPVEPPREVLMRALDIIDAIYDSRLCRITQARRAKDGKRKKPAPGAGFRSLT